MFLNTCLVYGSGLQSCVATRERWSFKRRSSKRSFTHVYVDPSLEVAAWKLVAEGDTNVALDTPMDAVDPSDPS